MRTSTIPLYLLTLLSLPALVGATVSGPDLLPESNQRAQDIEVTVLIAAAESGNPAAQFALGVRYESGQGIGKDYPKAATWYRKSADQGFADAKNNLGCLYLLGWGVPPDYQLAALLFEQAAEQGHAGAQNNVGSLYYRGVVVSRNYKVAAKWYHQAAQQGQEIAQLNLALMYAHGHGFERDHVEAYKWLLIAASGGSRNALLYQQRISPGLSEAEIATAHSRAKEHFVAGENVIAAHAIEQ